MNQAVPDAPDEQAERVRPYLDEDGVLIVPVRCDPAYRWWTPEGMALADILVELRVSRSVWKRYSPQDYPQALEQENYPLLGA